MELKQIKNKLIDLTSVSNSKGFECICIAIGLIQKEPKLLFDITLLYKIIEQEFFNLYGITVAAERAIRYAKKFFTPDDVCYGHNGEFLTRLYTKYIME